MEIQQVKKIMKWAIPTLCMVFLFVLVMPMQVAASEGEAVSNLYGSFWSLVPPIIAIALALITKEVYLSLFVGIMAGSLFAANFSPGTAIVQIIDTMMAQIGGNAGILIFLVALGIMVELMNRAGGSAAYGKWASSRIKTKRGSLLATFGLGLMIFVDDYFNCLTVGGVMSPVTDKYKVSRAKLAYIIDATAAPICIIAPVSSWAAAVTSYVDTDAIDGFSLFLQSIPYNLYALLTIIMVVAISAMQFDFGPMKAQEKIAESGDLFGGTGNEYLADQKVKASSKGKVIDLVLPVLVLIISCIGGMLYTGGFFSGTDFITAFGNASASVGLSIGSLLALMFTFILYISRKVISFRDFADSLPGGFRQMVPAIFILCFAWTLSGFCRDALGAGDFVSSVVSANAAASFLLPAVLFLIGVGIAFSTGTSWGTFGILIPIVTAIFPGGGELMVICVSACLAGAVCGDHISPISDTTIMASTGAQSNHITHVSTQIPYALVVAGVSFLGYILAGLLQNALITLAVCVVVLLVVLTFIRKKTMKSA